MFITAQKIGYFGNLKKEKKNEPKKKTVNSVTSKMAMLPTGSGGGNDGHQGGNSGGGGGRESRQTLMPKSYEDILKFAVENTDQENQSHEPLSEEKKQWLSQALSGMFTDEVKILKGKLEELEGIVESEGQEDEERKEALLEDITDLCDRIDNARDLIKLGGWRVISLCLDDSSPEVRWRALEVAGTILQNNEFVQDCLLKEDVMRKFMKIADEDRSDLVRIKAVFALSCHVREHNASEESFVKADGFPCLLRAMQRNNEKLQIKSAFLLKALLISQPKFKDDAQKVGMVQQLIGLLNTEHNPAHEHIAAALLCLVTDHPAAMSDCRSPELKLRQFLDDRLKLLRGKEEYQEELQYCQDLLTSVFSSSNHDDKSPADR